MGNARIKGEEDQKAAINAQSNKVKADADKLRGEIKELESTMEACEEDKATKDSQIRTLKEEIVHQEELVAKLTKEKRNIGDSRQKTEEDIQASEDKCNHLNNLWMNVKMPSNVKRRRNLMLKRSSAKLRVT